MPSESPSSQPPDMPPPPAASARDVTPPLPLRPSIAVRVMIATGWLMLSGLAIAVLLLLGAVMISLGANDY